MTGERARPAVSHLVDVGHVTRPAGPGNRTSSTRTAVRRNFVAKNTPSRTHVSCPGGVRLPGSSV